MPIVTISFERMLVDIADPLSKPSRGHQYILVLQSHSTGYSLFKLLFCILDVLREDWKQQPSVSKRPSQFLVELKECMQQTMSLARQPVETI